MVGNTVAFRVHAPCSGQLLLDIFANAVTPQEYLTGEPMKFKSVCKFKIVCSDLQTVMVPLPDCASGEWGPAKATRLFGLIPLTHQGRMRGVWWMDPAVGSEFMCRIQIRNWGNFFL